MTDRGEATRQRLMEATRAVVRESGYARATTRAIAQAADVTEGTIYRHFPDKTALFFAAAIGPHEQVMVEFAELPAQAGHDTVIDNLAGALRRLAVLRDDIVPLELAIMTDPELAAARSAAVQEVVGAEEMGPPGHLAEYLRAEQGLGRIRVDADPDQVSRTLLMLLFGVAMDPTAADRRAEAITDAVTLMVRGLIPD